ncbi:MAG TPA: hypothetical protein VGU02_12715 [Gaiellaceae bacterium]|nr:hypothetical protein [Gaiellaceae bacterium]
MRAFAPVAASIVALAPNLPQLHGWPPYPHFPARSCWTRVSEARDIGSVGGAPSFAPHAAKRMAPQALADRVLAQFGDHRFVTRVQIGPVPRLVREHNGYFHHGKPPRDAVWAWLAVPRMSLQYTKPPPAPVIQANSIASWEATLMWGALRDAFCANGGAPLVGWSVGGHPNGESDAMTPLEQRFPTPSRRAFTARAGAVGRRYGFRVLAVRWLRPLQAAPIVVVRTDRGRRSFVGDVPAIVQLLDPRASRGDRTAVTFEGFYFEATDARGPFVSTSEAYRGTVEGSQWSWNPCVYPYDHSAPFGQHC